MCGSDSKNDYLEMRKALDAAAGRVVPVVMLCLGILYFFLVFFHLLILPEEARLIMAMISGVSAILLIPSGLWLKNRGIEPNYSHPALFIALLIAIANSILHAWLLNDPMQTTNLMLLSFACGFMMYRITWFACGAITILLCWTGLSISTPFSQTWLHFGFALAFSCFLAGIVFWARLENFKKIRSFEINMIEQNSILADEVETRRKIEDSLMELNEELEERVMERTKKLEESKAHAEMLSHVARSAEIAKTRFLANVSHELVTPLNAILGLTSNISLSGNNNYLDEDSIKHVQRSAELLALHVGKMLDLSKLEAGQLAIEHEDFDIKQAIDETIRLFKVQSEQKGLRICSDYDLDQDILVKGDEKRIRQILSQFIGNAIKYTDTGEVLIELKVEKNAQESYARIDVTDSGQGLAPENEKRLTEAFSSGDDSLNRRSEGLGLGLALASRLASLMDGETGFYNNPGVGATFWLKLKITESTRINHYLEKRPTNESLDKKRILIVDDNPVNRLLAEKILKKIGFESSTASSGMESLNILRKEDYDAVLMDVQMEGMDGIEATIKIRSRECGVKNPDIPIIALTAHDTIEDRKSCTDAGMNGYVTKPLRSSQLLSAICQTIEI